MTLVPVTQEILDEYASFADCKCGSDGCQEYASMAQELLERRERDEMLEAVERSQHLLQESCNRYEAENAELRRDRDRLGEAHRGLRRRVHMLEAHNQHFERCESAWCNPGPDNDPASELGKPDKWPFGEDAAMAPKKEQA